jgi:hypothetical protein
LTEFGDGETCIVRQLRGPTGGNADCRSDEQPTVAEYDLPLDEPALDKHPLDLAVGRQRVNEVSDARRRPTDTKVKLALCVAGLEEDLQLANLLLSDR